MRVIVKNNVKLTDRLKRGNVQVAKVINENAMELVNEAKKASPVDTGFLRNSIQVAEYAKDNKHSAKVIVNAYYGIFVEYGTRRQRPQPFFTPAIEKIRKKLLEMTQRAIQVIIKYR